MSYRYGSDLDWEEVAKRDKERREEDLRRAQESAPKPGPRPEFPPISDAELKQALRIGPPYPAAIARHFMQFGAQVVETLPEGPKRDRFGNIPVEDGRSEVDRMLDPKAMLARINQLEQEVAALKPIADIVRRYFGGSADNGAGEVYR